MADTIGVSDSGVVPVAALGAVAAASVFTAAVIAVGPGLRTSRTPAAALLRGE